VVIRPNILSTSAGLRIRVEIVAWGKSSAMPGPGDHVLVERAADMSEASRTTRSEVDFERFS